LKTKFQFQIRTYPSLRDKTDWTGHILAAIYMVWMAKRSFGIPTKNREIDF